MSTDFEQIMYLLDTMKTQLMVTFPYYAHPDRGKV